LLKAGTLLLKKLNPNIKDFQGRLYQPQKSWIRLAVKEKAAIPFGNEQTGVPQCHPMLEKIRLPKTRLSFRVACARFAIPK
jgi:hypothetical protein